MTQSTFRTSLLFCLALLFLENCGQSQQQSTVAAASSATETVSPDTSGFFVRRILNASVVEVAKVLGKPDTKLKAGKDCDYLPSCREATYRNGKYEALFYHDKLKWLQIHVRGLFTEDAIKALGFQWCEPTFKSSLGIWWRNAETKGTATGPLVAIKGLRLLGAFENYVIITVETNYDGKF